MKHQTLTSIALGLTLALSTPLTGWGQSPSSDNTQKQPQLIPFKAKVSGPEIVNDQELIFRVFDQQTGGRLLFEERQTPHIMNGSYIVLLGTATPGGVPADVLASHATLWIEASDSSGASASGTRTAFALRRSISHLSSNSSSAVAFQSLASFCYTCGGAYPVFGGYISLPSGSYPSERGSSCSDNPAPHADVSPFLCTAY